jgi:hypothetical protein
MSLMTAQGWHALLPIHTDTWHFTAGAANSSNLAPLSAAQIMITLMDYYKVRFLSITRSKPATQVVDPARASLKSQSIA